MSLSHIEHVNSISSSMADFTSSSSACKPGPVNSFLRKGGQDIDAQFRAK